jgi:bacillithiol system protein YtxJ
MNWIKINSPDQLNEIKNNSNEDAVLVFKHSTTCSISNTTLNRLERNWEEADMPIKTYYLDLLNHRSISTQIASDFNVEHQSPQVLLIRKGQALFNASHFDINYADLKKEVSKIASSKN